VVGKAALVGLAAVGAVEAAGASTTAKAGLWAQVAERAAMVGLGATPGMAQVTAAVAVPGAPASSNLHREQLTPMEGPAATVQVLMARTVAMESVVARTSAVVAEAVVAQTPVAGLERRAVAKVEQVRGVEDLDKAAAGARVTCSPILATAVVGHL